MTHKHNMDIFIAILRKGMLGLMSMTMVSSIEMYESEKQKTPKYMLIRPM